LNEVNTSIEIIKILTKFISENFGYIVFLTLLIISREAISNFICRITNLTWKKGDSELGVEAVSPQPKIKEEKHFDQEDTPSELIDDKEQITEKKVIEELDWFEKVNIAFEKGNVNDAKDIFKKYELNEKNITQLETNKALFLYFLFINGKDNDAINQLKILVKSVSTEESRYQVLGWLSYCYQNGKQLDADIELWQENASKFSTQSFVIKSIVKLASSLIRGKKALEAKQKLLILFEENLSLDEKSNVYDALSEVENELGNKSMAVYCKDKSLELNPNNRKELFNAAYQASEEGIDELSVSNYVTLLQIDSKNSTALNNLGVRAQEVELKTKAVENYKLSSKEKNTLAMANQGYLLLNSGFIDEAKDIANKALKFEEPHENIYSLLSRIAEIEKQENEKWSKFVDSCMEHQIILRNFTQACYEGTEFNFKGEWKTENGELLDIEVENDKLNAKWQEVTSELSPSTFNISLNGKISRKAFQGQYSRNRISTTSSSGLLGYGHNKNIECIGIYDDESNILSIYSKNYSEKFCLKLQKINAHSR